MLFLKNLRIQRLFVGAIPPRNFTLYKSGLMVAGYRGLNTSNLPQSSRQFLKTSSTPAQHASLCLHSAQVYFCSAKTPSKLNWHGNTKQYHFEQDPCVPDNSLARNVMQEKIDFGILFDIDGVIARGSVPLQAAKRMMKLVTDDNNELRIPIAFCTNSTGMAKDKAQKLTDWLGVKIDPEQVIAAQGPLSVFHRYHHQRCLFVGQGDLHGIADELGFDNIVTMDEVKDAFPLLDIVDHSNRHWIAQNGITNHHHREDFVPIEAVILIGEPNRWEMNLQLLIDIIVTGGYPMFAPDVQLAETHLPILACNMDLVFMAEACMPRFGHGAFLVCLESLYKKITGQDLSYTALIGKPSEITFRYAEHVIADQAEKLGLERDINTLYIVGDNPEVDVYGANLYTRYIEDCLSNEMKGGGHSSRQVPNDYNFRPQTAEKCCGILVGTGVYDPKSGLIEDQDMEVYHHGHRDFKLEAELRVPTIYSTDVYDAVLSVLELEAAVSDELNNNVDKKQEQ